MDRPRKHAGANEWRHLPHRSRAFRALQRSTGALPFSLKCCRYGSSGGVKQTDEDSVPCLYELTFVHSVALITEVGAPSSLLFGFLPV